MKVPFLISRLAVLKSPPLWRARSTTICMSALALHCPGWPTVIVAVYRSMTDILRPLRHDPNLHRSATSAVVLRSDATLADCHHEGRVGHIPRAVIGPRLNSIYNAFALTSAMSRDAAQSQISLA